MVKRQSAVQSKQAEGAGVVVISSYLAEIIAVSNRILVARGGTIVAEFTRDEATPEKILHAAIH